MMRVKGKIVEVKVEEDSHMGERTWAGITVTRGRVDIIIQDTQWCITEYHSTFSQANTATDN